MRASPSLSQLWQPHSGLCHLCRACAQQRSCSPGFCRKELHATEGAVEVRRARRRLREAATDERVGVFTPDKKRGKFRFVPKLVDSAKITESKMALKIRAPGVRTAAWCEPPLKKVSAAMLLLPVSMQQPIERVTMT